MKASWVLNPHSCSCEPILSHTPVNSPPAAGTCFLSPEAAVATDLADGRSDTEEKKEKRTMWRRTPLTPTLPPSPPPLFCLFSISSISPPQKTGWSSHPLEEHKRWGLGKFSLDIPVLLKSHGTGWTSRIEACSNRGTAREQKWHLKAAGDYFCGGEAWLIYLIIDRYVNISSLSM